MAPWNMSHGVLAALLCTLFLTVFVMKGFKSTKGELENDDVELSFVDELDIHEMGRQKCLSYQKERYKALISPFVVGKNAILVDMVDHWNLGDSFIEWGEHLFLNETGNYPKQLCSLNACDWEEIDKSIAENPNNSVLLIHGGGNFGDLWIEERKHHRWIVLGHNNVPIVFLPQSVHYVDVKKCRKDYHLLRRHPNVQLFARDNHSLHTFRTHFKKNSSKLCPDAAFFIGNVKKCEESPIVDILIIARKDVEASSSLGSLDLNIQTVLNESGVSFLHTDWPCVEEESIILPHNPLDHAKSRFELGKKCLCRGKVLVTDRLHGVILAMLMGVPHVFLDNSYKKISSYRSANLGPVESCSDRNFKAIEAHNWKSALTKAKILSEGRYDEAVLWKQDD